MARKLRIQYPGAMYHVMNRGGHPEAIFQDDGDRLRFLDTLGQACEKTAWQVRAYCLMSNHQLRSQTTMSVAWIAERLGVATRGYLVWLLQQRGRTRPTATRTPGQPLLAL